MKTKLTSSSPQAIIKVGHVYRFTRKPAYSYQTLPNDAIGVITEMNDEGITVYFFDEDDENICSHNHYEDLDDLFSKETVTAVPPGTTITF